MSRVLGALLILIVLLLTISFSVINAHAVQINYYLGSTELPLALLMVLAVVTGIIVGGAIVATIALRMRVEIAKLRRNAKLTEKEISNLRSMPLKEPR